MAVISNPRKNFNYRVRVSAPFYNPFEVQECETPSVDLDVVEHGESNHVIKTAGQIKYGNATLKGIISQGAVISWVQVWVRQIQDVLLGGGDIPDLYKKNLTIEYLAIDGRTVVETEIWMGAWPCKLNGKSLKSIGSENIMNELEICVDKVVNSSSGGAIVPFV